jgi:hypothetical protein
MSLHAAIAAIVLASAGLARAQWTVINLHPAGALWSQASGISAGQQVGYARFNASVHAALWTGSAASFVDLQPAGASESFALCVDGGQQVGEVIIGGVPHASLWTGTVASWVDLNPLGYSSSANAVRGGVQVGHAGALAARWAGTATSWSSFPSGGLGYTVVASGISPEVVCGVRTDSLGNVAAVCLSGCTFLLSPAGATQSMALAVDGRRVVGYARTENVDRATLWTNATSQSAVYLHPAGATYSRANAIFGQWQAGAAQFGVSPLKSSVWSGTAASWEDLSLALPASFSESRAQGIWSDAAMLYVVGSGRNTVTNQFEALLWMRPLNPPPPPCYPNCDGSTAPPVLNVQDFTCFLQRYAASDPYANCDNSTTVPTLNVQDFTCFLQSYATGCP